MKCIIFGNSGSGKSTLAKQLSGRFNLAHLDLDILAWQDTHPPIRNPLQESAVKINNFIKENNQWVIEGGYADLLALVLPQISEMFFLNLGVDKCISHCKKRPWEKHKYESMQEQNNNLAMLIGWLKDYENRDDDFSLFSHRRLFDDFEGKKTEYTTEEEIQAAFLN